jgi:FtsP/CotA-like multicopper oxidase with cupredoxin domain
MRLHGYAFQVVGISTNRFSGALRDTVNVRPMIMVTNAIYAGDGARWLLQHHQPHLASGMLTEFTVTT